MRTSMTYPIRFWAFLLVCLLIFQFSSEAVASWCKYTTDIEMTLDLSDTDELAISAVAGELDIVGIAGLDEAVIHGKVCASKEAWLNESRIDTRTGKLAEINVMLPETDKGWSFGLSSYVSMDLRIDVPEEMMLRIKDSSGDLSLDGVGAVNLQDSSGDIEIDHSNGAVAIRDSSGDIDIDQVQGDLTIEADSSGDIYIEHVEGEVLVEQDSSGDIRVSHVKDSVVVLRDSSGDIRATDVGGDFKVHRDGSGGIRSSNIRGVTELPYKG